MFKLPKFLSDLFWPSPLPASDRRRIGRAEVVRHLRIADTIAEEAGLPHLARFLSLVLRAVVNGEEAKAAERLALTLGKRPDLPRAWRQGGQS